MNLIFYVYTSIVAILNRLSGTADNARANRSVYTTVSNSTVAFNSTVDTVEYANITSTGHELFFFAHGDWGKSGFFDTSIVRRLREHMRISSGEGENHEEDHDHDEEHEHEHERKEEEFWQGRVARSMLKVANETKPSFILARRQPTLMGWNPPMTACGTLIFETYTLGVTSYSGVPWRL